MAANAQLESLRRMARAGAYNRWLVDRARPFIGRNVLDIGAGTGTLTSAFAELAETVVALEPDASLVPVLRETLSVHRNVVVVEGRAEELPELGLGPFDSVVCLNVLEHIRDDHDAVRSIHQVLRPGGELLLLVPAHPRLYGAVDETVGHERRYRPERLARLFLESEFEIEDLRFVNPVGLLGWFVSSRLLRREHVPTGPVSLYDRLVPLLRPLDALRLPFGLSLWAVARRPRRQ